MHLENDLKRYDSLLFCHASAICKTRKTKELQGLKVAAAEETEVSPNPVPNSFLKRDIPACFRDAQPVHAHATAALALMASITFLMPIHTDKSEKTSTMLPWSVNGDSCSTDRSFIMPLWTMNSTIWFTK